MSSRGLIENCRAAIAAQENEKLCRMSRISQWLALIVVTVVLAGCEPASDAGRDQSGAAPSTDQYQRHRVLIWAIDKESHDIRGFDEKTIQPDRQIELEPVQGYKVRCEAGPIKKVTISDFRREWQEDHVPFKISHGTGSAEGTMDLRSPFLHMVYGINEELDSVLVALPIGTIEAGPLAKLVAPDYSGTAAELEDLLRVAALDPNYDDSIGLYDLVELYRLLGRSERTDHWRRLLDRGTPRERLMAAAVLTRLGDERGTKVFCVACLEEKGNRQVGLIEFLCMIPPSEETLETIVKLIVSPT
ncbi:MAG: hypothetical protein KY476_04440, partial [Planctomycetes bacterium]|nr:hypothetical protein [Planctomycetota bacterium]